MKAVIFDMDGVVIDSERKRFEDLKRVLAKHDINLPEDTFKSMTGKKTVYFLQEQFPDLTKEAEKIFAEERRELERRGIENIPLLPDVKDVLEALKEKNITMAICTGTHRDIINTLLKHNQLEEYFSVIVAGEDFNTSKPDPECYNTTLDKLGIAPNECVVIEDAVAGVQAAKNAGCEVWGLLSYESKEALFLADKIFKNHKEILEHIKNV